MYTASLGSVEHLEAGTHTFRFTAVNATLKNLSFDFVGLIKKKAVSESTAIQMKSSGHPNITNINSTALTINAINGTTVEQIVSQVESTDGSEQNYAVTDANNAVKAGMLETGDKLVVIAANGTSNAAYYIIVDVNIPDLEPVAIEAAEIAAAITTIVAPAKGATALTLPTVPTFYSIAIKSSSNEDVIAINGTIVPPSTQTIVTIVLEVTRSSDGTTASTGPIQVTVPAKSDDQETVDPGDKETEAPDDQESGNPGNQYVPPVTDSSNKESYTVSLQDLNKTPVDGKVTIQAANEVKKIVLPGNAGDLIGSNALAITTDKVSFEVPSDVLKQLQTLGAASDTKDGSIVLNFNPLTEAEANRIIASGEASSQAQLKAAGEVYELSLSFVTKDGKSTPLTSFNQPIIIRLKVDPSVNPSLAGIYYIADNGTLEYIGGQYINGEMVAEIQHFSKYAVLEFKKTFADLASTHWAITPIQELAAKHILSGTSASTFEPERAITRAEFTALLVNALKLSTVGEIQFADVKATDWYAQAISIAVKSGIVSGKSESIFDPKGKITREEMVAMLMRAYEVKIGKKLASYKQSKFSDVSQVSSWAANYVNAAGELGLVKGRAAGLFAPRGITTRAEAAQIIFNLLKL